METNQHQTECKAANYSFVIFRMLRESLREMETRIRAALVEQGAKPENIKLVYDERDSRIFLLCTDTNSGYELFAKTAAVTVVPDAATGQYIRTQYV